MHLSCGMYVCHSSCVCVYMCACVLVCVWHELNIQMHICTYMYTQLCTSIGTDMSFRTVEILPHSRQLVVHTYTLSNESRNEFEWIVAHMWMSLGSNMMWHTLYLIMHTYTHMRTPTAQIYSRARTRAHIWVLSHIQIYMHTYIQTTDPFIHTYMQYIHTYMYFHASTHVRDVMMRAGKTAEIYTYILLLCYATILW